MGRVLGAPRSPARATIRLKRPSHAIERATFREQTPSVGSSQVQCRDVLVRTAVGARPCQNSKTWAEGPNFQFAMIAPGWTRSTRFEWSKWPTETNFRAACSGRKYMVWDASQSPGMARSNTAVCSELSSLSSRQELPGEEW